MFKFRKVFMFFFIVTLVGSLFTYKIVTKAYTVYTDFDEDGYLLARPQ